MEVKVGVTYSVRELVVETDRAPDEIAGLVDAAVSGKDSVLWLTDTNGRRVGIPTDKLAYVELGEDNSGKRVGFGM
jgi:hypothetical protein